jgi:hypothetical protein
MNVPSRVELSQAERVKPGTLLSGGKHAARKLKRAQILLATDAGRATRRSPARLGWAARQGTGPSGASCWATWRRR